MYITNDDKQNYLFFILKLLVQRLRCLDTTSWEQKNQNKIKTSIVFSERIRERIYKTLCTSTIHSPLTPWLMPHNKILCTSLLLKLLLILSPNLITPWPRKQ